MQPVDMQHIGDELAIRWPDGTESYIPLERLRQYCPCAGCKGEVDILGNVHRGPARPMTPASFHLLRLDRVGGYAIQPVWGDGHSTGIYSFEYLRRIEG